MSKKALIFGSQGFVAQYLARELEECGYDVFGASLGVGGECKSFHDVSTANILDFESVKSALDRYLPDAVINLAAISSVGASWSCMRETFKVNVGGAINILDAVASFKNPPKVLLIGSSEEYSPKNRSLRESDALDSTNPYGLSKVAQEKISVLYEAKYGLRIYRTRSFNHTGVGQNTSFVLPGWCEAAARIEASGNDGIIRVGNTAVSRDFSDVRDVVRAYRMLLDSECYGKTFNIGSGRCLKLQTLLNDIIAMSSRNIEVQVDPNLLRPTDNPVVVCNREKITGTLGWEPQFAIEDTLREMFDAYLESFAGTLKD